MIFEVLNQQNQRIFYTEHWSCVPSEEELSAISSAMYKFKLDGKAVSLNKMQAMVHVEPVISAKDRKVKSKKLF